MRGRQNACMHACQSQSQTTCPQLHPLNVDLLCSVPPFWCRSDSISRDGSAVARAMLVSPFLPTGASGFAPSLKRRTTVELSPRFTASYSLRSFLAVDMLVVVVVVGGVLSGMGDVVVGVVERAVVGR